MVRQTARTLQADQRRSELIDASLRLFAERGFRATTIADIAAATGTAHGLVYHYFDSKDDLLAAVLERYAFLPRLRALLAVSPDRPAAEVLSEIAVGLSEVLGERPELLRLVVAESPTNPIVARALARVTEEGQAVLTEYLRARIVAGELRIHDPTVPARALFWAIIAKHLGPADVDAFETDLVAVLLDGIRAD
ncbi:MAG TPA: TetR/AcrR family transcriptional regulator [Candidatus Limnocylindrales bacterium]|nr:TetR/AcrR family transcriptional regulator [Candidatus Limnocylindrales bacterium]